MAITSLVASVVSVILGALAIFISMYFYTQSKNTEASVANNLEAIRTQTEMLQKLTGRWMDRLTRYVTEEQPKNTEQVMLLLTAIREFPQLREAPQSQSSLPFQGQTDPRVLLATQAALFYYSSAANFFAQFALPPLEEYDTNLEMSNFIKRVVDLSKNDFEIVASLLQQSDTNVLNGLPVKDLYDMAGVVFRPHVLDSTGYYAKRAEK